MKITKTVIPAAGLGTRFLPYTKSVPKELVPVMGKPAIQIIVEEGIASGITHFEIIANKDKQAIVNYFSANTQLDDHLRKNGKEHLVDSINAIINTAQFHYIPQPQALGLGHAILMAEQEIGNDYFGICLPDEIMIGKKPALAQLIKIAEYYNASVIAVQEVPQNAVSAYGIIAVKKQLADGLFEIDHLIEKPSTDTAPSNLAIIGRYILSPHIFDALKSVKPGVGNEIQLTDGIAAMMNNGERVLTYKVDSIRHDIGNPLGWLQANLYCGLSDPAYAETLKSYIEKIISHD
jgi:UTP--glucose-1-phosphate uridylyltransferase